MLSREPLHTLQLQTYYDNRQFDRMWTYLQRYELSGDTYLIYEQAVDLYLELTSFAMPAMRCTIWKIRRYWSSFC